MLALGVMFIYRIRDGISKDWRWEGEVFMNTHSVPSAFQNAVAVHGAHLEKQWLDRRVLLGDAN